MRRTVVLLIALGALCACTPAVTLEEAPRVAGAQQDQRERTDTGWPGIDGFYLSGEMVLAEASDDSMRVASALRCPNLVDALGAGEWREVNRAEAPPEIAFLMAFSGTAFEVTTLLQRGEQFAWVAASGRPYCSADVRVLLRESLRLSGVVDYDGDAFVYPMQCIAVDGDVTITLLYDTPGALQAVVKFQMPFRGGDQEPSGNDFSVSTFRHEGWYFDIIGDALAAQAQNPDAELDFGEGQEFGQGPEFEGTVQVESRRPLSGTFRFERLIGGRGQRQDIRGAFSCDVQVMELADQ